MILCPLSIGTPRIIIMMFPNWYRITSYNVCYTKFLRVQSDGTSQVARHMEYQYQIEPSKHARTPSFAMPVQIMSFDWSASQNDFIPTQKQTASYDVFNQPVARSLSFYNASSKAFTGQTQESYTYQLVSLSEGHSIEMPATGSQTDAVSGQTISTSFTLTSDKKSVAEKTSLIQAERGGICVPWKAIQYLYDNSGRIIEVTSSWADGAAPVPGVSNICTKYAYSYDATTHEGCVVVTNSLGNTNTEYTRQNLPQAPVCRRIDGLGNVISMTLDAFGRPLTITQPDGSVSKTVYQCWSLNKVNQMQSTNPLGYVLATQFDGP